MDAAFDAGIRAGEITFDTSDVALLRAVDDAGSVSAAAETLGRSRSRALRRLETLEEVFGPLVERRRGGADGGGSRLTEEARALVARFERLRAALSGTAGADEVVFTGTLVERDGELGRVETPAGTVRALVPDGVAEDDRVQVSVRADAVTLHEPGGSPAAGATSARNRFAGTVSQVRRGESVATVSVKVGVSDPLLALVTVESVERLGLVPGVGVVATFKATATRATPVVEAGE
ncbi:TOBE domain-containing protein [Halobium salinum]|uniref:TOBE domain-containing protein n=1 Tax=Halobium salinum TaxID=1364940 RepID=A0ABD5PBM5_9EURY|nr:TOBE domain-containing protein [Halobium salinum]